MRQLNFLDDVQDAIRDEMLPDSEKNRIAQRQASWAWNQSYMTQFWLARLRMADDQVRIAFIQARLDYLRELGE